MTDRAYDLVLFGATGFTGELTARYLAEHAPPGLRWAIAGRNAGKLAAVRQRLATDRPTLSELPLLIAHSDDQAALAELARSSRVVMTTVGPYLNYGEPLVAACAAAGTDYLDLTGEPEFVDRMYNRYQRRATETGARLVHCCGFDSIPYDLGVLFTVDRLPDDQPISVQGVVRAGGRPSGGTLASAVTALSRTGPAAREARRRKAAETRPDGRTARAVADRIRRQDGLWLVPLPTVDPQIVARSARALPGYGPDFRYSHYAGVRSLPVLVGGAAGLATVFTLVQLPPARRLLLSRIESGSGPTEQQREQGWFRVRFTARTRDRTLVTEVSGGDPGYTETAVMLAEAGLCLALDHLPPAAGQLTPAVAMGQALIDRLSTAGIRFRVLSDTGAN